MSAYKSQTLGATPSSLTSVFQKLMEETFLPWQDILLPTLYGAESVQVQNAWEPMLYTSSKGFCQSPEGISKDARFCSPQYSHLLLEGWGPISYAREFDLTPCFEQGVLVPVCLLFLLVFGLARIWSSAKLSNAGAYQAPIRGKKSSFILSSKIVSSLCRSAALETHKVHSGL